MGLYTAYEVMCNQARRGQFKIADFKEVEQYYLNLNKQTNKSMEQKEQTTQGPAICRQLAKVMEGITAIDKSRRNEQQNYMYRGTDDLMNSIHALFAQNGIVIIPRELEIRQETLSMAPDRAGNPRSQYRTTLHIEYRFLSGEDGSEITADAWGEGFDMADKGLYKAKTFALKYILSQMFLVPTKDDTTAPARYQGQTPPPEPRHYQQAAPAPQQVVRTGESGKTDLEQALEDIRAARDIAELTRVRVLWPQLLNDPTFLTAGVTKQRELKSQQ